MKQWSTPTLQPPKDSLRLRALDVWSEMSMPCCMPAPWSVVVRGHLVGCALHGNPLLITRKFLICLVYVVTGKELW
jgi:hypothetical protein